MSPKLTSYEILIFAGLAVLAILVILAYRERHNLQERITWLGKFFSPELEADTNANRRLF
jgi:hypothetical protein